MLELCSEQDLALETLSAKRERDFGMEDLDGHGPLVSHIPGEKHRSHPALAKLALDLVPLGQTAPQSLEGVHGWNNVGRGGIRQRITSRCTLVPPAWYSLRTVIPLP